MKIVRRMKKGEDLEEEKEENYVAQMGKLLRKRIKEEGKTGLEEYSEGEEGLGV